MAQWWACRIHDLVVVSSDPVEAKFLCSVFPPLTSAETCEKSSRWFWKEIHVNTGVREPGNTCVTDRHGMTLAVKVALNLNTTNQPAMNTFSHIVFYRFRELELLRTDFVVYRILFLLAQGFIKPSFSVMSKCMIVWYQSICLPDPVFLKNGVLN